MVPNHTAHQVDKTSVLLKSVRRDLPSDFTSINLILAQLGRRSFGGILIVFAGLGLIPGLSVVIGLIVAVIGAQMVSGYKAPVLPKFLTSRELRADAVQKVLGKSIGYVETIEKWVHPRLAPLTSHAFTIVVGGVIVVLGLIMVLPLPFSNLPPAIAIIVLSVGQLERDGLMILVGLLFSIASLATGIFVAEVALEGIHQFFN